MILSKIIKHKADLIAFEKDIVPEALLFAEIASISPPISFYDALCSNDISIIAEVKKASPSKGIIRKDFDVEAIAQIYEKAPIDCISVLTEEKFFLGSNDNLKIVKDYSSKPVLRKDFIIDPYQIFQTRQLGADAVLLIASILSLKDMTEYLHLVHHLGMDAIVEVHNRIELDQAVKAGARIIGINNRDLKTFKTSLSVTEALLPFVPKDCIVVSESGINTHDDILKLESLGVHAVLVGESIMREDNMMDKINELRGVLHDSN